ncbi:MarR family winged helix-turn-helix transcriptional regulator [Actinomadura parmotrematis]|uniref:MarR family transcriptional regulator n=1 Tax=Actinomadura parmotrematis TaxID=2864039 RepID=A0ABS7G161_9ACTN|nr:MarR family transcriptional regulator [Actinomadura parmotrematis]MBW8485577.1 MarR family transcriptional regulator [Actinomadura parmotrematis]
MRDEDVETIRWELTAFSRRARALAERLHPGLSLVSYSLLGHLAEEGGCRATDLAAYFLLDKSTVSRQVGDLERMGLVERLPDPASQRNKILRPTEAGLATLRTAGERQRAAFRARLDDWSDADLAAFARYLVRYNVAD